jgi:glycosyltransferase involved in cell wall biosynthesis
MLWKEGGEFENLLPNKIQRRVLYFKPTSKHRIKFKLYRALNSKKAHPAQLFWKSIESDIPNDNVHYDIAISWGQGFATYYVATKIQATKKYAWINIDYTKAGYKFIFDQNKYNQFDKIVGVSEFVKESMEKFINPNKVIHIRNIIDPDEIINRASESIKEEFDPNFINLVSVGRLAKQKGFELAIKAVSILIKKHQNIRLYIIGEGGERDYLENLIRKLNLEKSCFLLGVRNNPYPYMKSSTIYLQSSWFEGLGRTIIEASLLCKPIVTTDFPTAFSILEPNETGIITKMDENSIAEGIQKLIENSTLKDLLIDNLNKREDKQKIQTLKLVDNLFNE